MKQETIDNAMDITAARLQDQVVATGFTGGAKCIAADTVHTFLTQLIDSRPGIIVGHALKMARGYVKRWQDKNGCR